MTALLDHVTAQNIASRLLGEAPGRRPGDPGPSLRTLGDVHRAFAARKPGHLKSRHNGGMALMSDGVSLWSYGYYELARWVSTGKDDWGPYCIYRTGKLYSASTTRHMRGLEAHPRFPAVNVTPRAVAGMKL